MDFITNKVELTFTNDGFQIVLLLPKLTTKNLFSYITVP